ncbi:hypothetical protein [Microvirga massiliensis]|uniref:hypothetical protein n=1 Tax=Microvirga massiliensis TaxID=1033741 RepID=UPI00065FF7F2|nr:hypothetical protein [Microvirga massiliensis]
MWPNRNPERDLGTLLARIETAHRIDADLLSAILRGACPRLGTSLAPKAEVERLVGAEAWVELGLWLIGWELPDWDIHRLTRDDDRWRCSIGVSGIAVNWAEDIVEFQHGSLPLAVLGAFVQAQLRKAEGAAPSNVTPFRRPGPSPLAEPTSPHPASR